MSLSWRRISGPSAKVHVALLVFLYFLMLYVNFQWSTILSNTFWWLKHLNLLVNMSTKAYGHTKSIWKHKKAYNSTHKHSKQNKNYLQPKRCRCRHLLGPFSFFFFILVWSCLWHGSLMLVLNKMVFIKKKETKKDYQGSNPFFDIIGLLWCSSSSL